MAEDKTSPESKIFLNGQEIPPDLRVDLLDVCVRQYIEGADCFDITVNALDSTNQQLKWIDSEDFNPGNTVEVRMGYLNEHETMIVGEITALHAHYSNDEATLLNVQGFDKLHRFRRGRNTQSFLEMKDSQIAEKIAQKMGLTPEIEDSEIVHDYVLQNNLSDIDFLLERARRIRFEVNVADQTLSFRKAANYLGKTVTLEYMRGDLKTFSPRLSTAQQVSEVIVRGWNPKSKEPILGVAKVGDETTDMEGSIIGPKIAEQAFDKTMAEIVDIPIVSQSEAEQIAKAKFNDLAIELICGEGEAVGNPQIRAGTTIELLGLGRRFSGIYHIRSCEHRMTPQIGYITKFNAERNAS